MAVSVPCTRRHLLAASASVAAVSRFGASAAAAADLPSLKAIGAAKGIVVGTCYSGEGDGHDEALLRHHAALITPEWCLKPRYLRAREDAAYRFDKADAIHAFCREAGLAFHGHTLFWYAEPLGWAESDVLETAVEKYGGFLADVVGRYGDAVSWDVANEIVADSAARDVGTLRSDDFLIRTHGERFVDFLFRDVARLAPQALLTLNENNVECGRSWCTAKRARLLDLVDGFKTRGVPIGAVGIQSHLSSRHGIDVAGTFELIERLAERGLDVHISEIDVNDVAFDDDVAARDQQVADMYHAYLTGVLRHPAVRRVVFWGLSDRDHWMVRDLIEDGRPAGDGRPALFDWNRAPKPAFHAVVDALSAARGR